MSNTWGSDFLSGLAARRAAKTRTGTGASSASVPAGPKVPTRSQAASWDSIADSLNAKAGLKRGANTAPAATTRDPSRARHSPPKAGAVDWSDIAESVNAEAGVTPTTSTGA